MQAVAQRSILRRRSLADAERASAREREKEGEPHRRRAPRTTVVRLAVQVVGAAVPQRPLKRTGTASSRHITAVGSTAAGTWQTAAAAVAVANARALARSVATIDCNTGSCGLER